MSGEMLVWRRAELLEAAVEEEVLALHVESGTCYGFNATASRVWALIESPRTIGEITAALQAEFEIEPDICRREVLELLRDLKQDGLIELESTGGQK